ncbi:hypothetical protein [Microbispora sp. CSR-4]|uniref:hypothetical protein n=1 Tax=Microbispora sp. CSR-4 TaxID=2592813 RepID=UPI0011CA831B|nr:hypothetical protein [Microbispora sp. CSR-4]
MATGIAWVNVQGGTWTPLFKGPSFHIAGVQVMELTALTSAQSEYLVSFTVHRYSGAAPFYYSISNSRFAIAQSAYIPGSNSQNIFYLPAISISPWTEVWLLTDRSCRAHLLI